MEITKILLTTKLTDPQIEHIKESLGDEFELIVPAKFNEEEIIKHILDVKILLGHNIYKSMLDGGNIELIQIPWAGVEKLDFKLL